MNPKSIISGLNAYRSKEMKNNFFNHLKTILLNEESSFIGEIKDESFCLWRHSYWWTGIFYPVINGEISPDGNKINFSTSINIIGKLFFVVITLTLIYGTITQIVVQENNDLIFLIPRIIISLLFVAIFLIGPILVYRLIRKREVQHFRNLIKTVANTGHTS